MYTKPQMNTSSHLIQMYEIYGLTLEMNLMNTKECKAQ